MRHDKPGPGKFEGNGSRRLSEALYNRVGNGFASDELGDVQDFGWYGLVLQGNHGYIVSEDNFGFFSYKRYSTIQAAREQWTKIEADYEEFCCQTDADNG